MWGPKVMKVVKVVKVEMGKVERGEVDNIGNNSRLRQRRSRHQDNMSALSSFDHRIGRKFCFCRFFLAVVTMAAVP